MTDQLLTACGLRVLPGEAPRNWGPFTWVQEVDDVAASTLAADVALMMIRADLMKDAASTADMDQWTMPLDLAFASLHDGDVPRADSFGRLDVADPTVSSREEGVAASLDLSTYRPFTVCGIIEGTWRSVCKQKLAPSPLAAYLWTWQAYHDRGKYLLLAAVHEGQVEAINEFHYADGGSSITAVEMTARDVWGMR